MTEVASQIKDLKNKNNTIETRINELNNEVNTETDQKKIAELALDIIDKYMSSFDTLDLTKKNTYKTIS